MDIAVSTLGASASVEFVEAALRAALKSLLSGDRLSRIALPAKGDRGAPPSRSPHRTGDTAQAAPPMLVLGLLVESADAFGGCGAT
ncbi:hypothetical protein BH24ACT5_BH24ACT5_21940 [soil metagenome]